MTDTCRRVISRNWTLGELLDGMVSVPPALANLEIVGVTQDSRNVRPGDAFFACRGVKTDGHRYINDAIRSGAAVVFFDQEKTPQITLDRAVPLVRIENLQGRMGQIAARFYGDPTGELFTVGVTGTNGKTSTSHFAAHGLTKGAAIPCGLIGTVGSGVYGQLTDSTHTTPDAVNLQCVLASIRDGGSRDVVLEVSSHGLDQQRLNGVEFDVAVFTNLTRDHLDYHGNMAAYAAAKKRFFGWPTLEWGIANLADDFCREMLQELPPRAKAIGYLASENRKKLTQLPSWCKEVVTGWVRSSSAEGMVIEISGPWGSGELSTGLVGTFTASNLLAALVVLLAKGIPLDDALGRLATARGVPGRLEVFRAAGFPLVVVDYAHTPDALRNVLEVTRGFCGGQLWVVFGCGGDRDRGKRPQMGAIAQALSDRIVLADDNPRTENPQQIVEDILAGMSHAGGVASVMHDRRLAVEYALTHAQPQDVVLLAGKGHESYQDIAGVKRVFSDRLLVKQLLGIVS